MSLAPGTRFGPYEIISPLGAGGMGEVFRARDTKLDRDVAIKVLPESFAADADRLARFTREAKTLASLNHPNIAGIYGIEANAIVMELVEGQDLSEMIGGGAEAHALHLPDTIAIARQIADALEAAHEQGIVHRDLKPANIKVRADGTVKVLDFGLAKAMDPAGASSDAAMNSPTMTARATQMGMIIGTAAYMAPEQARGKAVDRRADIWAFGCVLFEMLTGTRAFAGDDITDVLAAVVRAEPEWQRLPADLSPTLRMFLQRCLQKDAKQRIGDIHDVRLALDGAFDSAHASSVVADVQPATTRSRWLPWAVTAVFGVALAAALVEWAPWRTSAVSPPRKLLASIGADATLVAESGAAAILSPDGTTLAFVGLKGGEKQIYVRKLDQLQAAPVSGTAGASDPFFSPDGQFLGFASDRKLKKIPVTGGTATTLADGSPRGASWADDDMIYFISSQRTLMRVPASGGTPTPLANVNANGAAQKFPQALPGGRAVLYSEQRSDIELNAGDIVVAPVAGGAPKVVVQGGYYGRYMSSGHVLYVKNGTLFAVRFDLDRLEVIGSAVPVIEGVASGFTGNGGSQYAISNEGTLVYASGIGASDAKQIDWLTRDGKSTLLRSTRSSWSDARFSPDGTRLAFDILDDKGRRVWVYDWARDVATQLTFGPGEDSSPVWTPDGKRITFGSDRAKAGILSIYEVNADGTGVVTRLTDSPYKQRPWSWHPNGKVLAFYATRPETGHDLFMLTMDGDGANRRPGAVSVFQGLPTSEVAPNFSPDGRFVAFFSSQNNGIFDIYVRPLAGPGGPWRISTDGGLYPVWSAASHELLYVDPRRGLVMAAPYSIVGDSFQAGAPKIWSPTTVRSSGSWTAYDGFHLAVHPDGTRIATELATDELKALQDKLVFVFNFGDYLKKIVPGKR